jgi:hypothetical protein
MTYKRVIQEGALRPLRDPSPEPPGPRGTIPLDPISGRPFPPAALKDVIAQPSVPSKQRPHPGL